MIVLMRMNLTAKMLPLMVLLLTFVSVNQWATIKLGNLVTTALLQLLFLIFIYRTKKDIFFPLDKKCYKPVSFYFIWTYICIARGLLVAENYMEYKQLLLGSISCMIPVLVWVFYRPDITQRIFQVWFKYGMLFFLLFYWWNAGFTQFYLSPLLLLFCFFPLFPKWKSIVILLLAFMYCYCGELADNRSQLIKGFVAICVGIVSICALQFPKKLIKAGHIIAYSTILIVFGLILVNVGGVLTGELSAEEAKYNNEGNEFLNDSRSLIYVDVINSAVDNNYAVWGRTPARGNDINLSYTLFFWAYDDLDFNKNERFKNEIVHLNIFTWEGIVGLILYSWIYFRASYLAVYNSRNVYISLLGCFIAFRWVFGWVEDINEFNILNIALWSMIGMCFSDKFRDMTNFEFKQWIRSLI